MNVQKFYRQNDKEDSNAKGRRNSFRLSKVVPKYYLEELLPDRNCKHIQEKVELGWNQLLVF